MINLQVNLTLSQFSAISEIITPAQLLRIKYVIDNPAIIQKLPFRPSKPIQLTDTSGKGFQRPEEHPEPIDDEAWRAVDADPHAQPDSPIGSITTSTGQPIKGVIFERTSLTATRKKGGGKGPKMAAFGRTPDQVEAYVKAEEERTEDLDEETILKQERADERKAAKAIKDAEIKVKKDDALKVQQEIDDIKKADEDIDIVKSIFKNPWI